MKVTEHVMLRVISFSKKWIQILNMALTQDNSEVIQYSCSAAVISAHAEGPELIQNAKSLLRLPSAHRHEGLATDHTAH